MGPRGVVTATGPLGRALERRLRDRLSKYEAPEFTLKWIVHRSVLTLRALGKKDVGYWPTPTSTNRERDAQTLAKCAAFRKRNANQNTVPLYLGEVARMAEAHPSGKELDPAFPRWLVGFPPSWDEVSPRYGDWREFQRLM